MLNLNTTGAYKKLRSLRAELRSRNEKITGTILADTLDKYSERGQAYIDGLHQMINYNHLADADDAYLWDKAEVRMTRTFD